MAPKAQSGSVAPKRPPDPDSAALHPGSLPRRHDLVWLDPGAAGCWDAAPHDRAVLLDWIDGRLPLTAARRTQAAPAGWLNLGFTLPGHGARRRVAVAAAPAAVVRHRPPLTLAEALPYAPAPWRDGMARLAADCDAAGLAPRIYGSLATQILCGEACLRADSDLDLLMDCADAGRVRAALEVLSNHAGPGPRLDGELRLGSGWAVAWRELAEALAAPAPRRVLAKSDAAVALLTLEDILAPPTPRPDGAQRNPGSYLEPLPSPDSAFGSIRATRRPRRNAP